jgi:hypothetical protein
MVAFGGIGISMARQSKSPARLLLPEDPIRVLLLRANELRFGAKSATRPKCSGPDRHGGGFPERASDFLVY